MKSSLSLAFTAIALTLLGCNNGPKRDLNEDSGLDHVSQGPKLAPQRVAHGISKLEKYQKFSFDVPPHALTPRLQGEFKSFMQGAGGARIADESADVELMVMTEDQYDAFTHKRSAESLYAIEPSHDHGVSIALPTTQADAAHYFVVFTRSTDGKTPVWVSADLNVNFDSTL
ncbi:MAG: hypothetical protein DMG80_15980 [Acidobacteria bacterium]|nr:MAG: hypothetical protein DMG80_15980 [Acidobacteriota bacterium]